jgi:signal transduction histidine kinase
MKPVRNRKIFWLKWFSLHRRSAFALIAAVVLLACAALLGARLWLQAHPVGQARYAVDFSRPDAWRALGGDWDARTGEIESKSEERGAKLVSRLGPWQDFQVRADLKIAQPNGEAGILLRSSDEEEGADSYRGYYAGIRTIDGVIEFGRSDFGWHSLVRGRLPEHADLSGWMHLRVVVVGCAFLFEVTLPDGRASRLLINDTDCLAAGRFGLRSSLNSASWKNLRIAPAAASDLDSSAAPADQVGTLPPASIEAASPADAAPYIAAFIAEARKHAVLPGVQPINRFLMSPGRHPDVTLQGTVISSQPLIAIQDDSGALIVPDLDPASNLKRGDVVEAQGDVVSSRFRSQLDHARVRVLWSDMPIPPLAVSASELTSGVYRGRTIAIDGTLISVHVQSPGYELVLKDHDFLFRAVGVREFPLSPAELEPGSRLRLVGTATSLARFTDNMYPFAVVVDRFDLLAAPPWWSLRHILLLLLLAGLLFLTAQLALHRLQRWHTNSLLREREQLAFEMHDSLAQNFTGIAYQLQAASLEKRGESYIRAHIANALDMVHLCHREASRTIAALRPQYRDAAAILTALRESGERLSDGGLRIETSLAGKNIKLPLRITDALVRIGQEALSNAIQHSGCSEIVIDLCLHRREIDFAVRDNGCGLPEANAREGFGIAGMRGRAAKIRAEFRIESRAGQGTTVSVHAVQPAALSLWGLLGQLAKR